MLGFAQKIVFLRSDASGKTCKGFLEEINGERWLLAAMMCDGAIEIYILIRMMDNEAAFDAKVFSSTIVQVLDHITWLFFEGGVFQVGGHTEFIMKWYESHTHHFVVGSVGKSIGGMPFSHATRQSCLKHMQAWVILASQCLEAEFPSFTFLSCFDAFQLPKDQPSANFMTSTLETKIKRLAQIFNRNQNQFLAQFKRFYHHAFLVYKSSDFVYGQWQCWQEGIVRGSGGCQNAGADILFVIKRGKTMAPVTSEVEQNFSYIEGKLGDRRLHAKAEVEDRNINLLLMDLSSEARLNDLLERAVKIWQECFPYHSRTHYTTRLDKGTFHNHQKADSQSSEKAFLKRLHSNIASQARPGASSMLSDGSQTVPSIWTNTHDAERAFQQDKRQKRFVEASIHGQLLPSDQTEELRREADLEQTRQNKSFADRTNARKKYALQTTANPPSESELTGAILFVDDGVLIPEVNLLHLQATTTQEAWKATTFVSKTPRNPTKAIITLAACLRGAWVVSPEALMNTPGPSIKYLSALRTKRQLWASPSFCRDYLVEWLLILELLNTCENKWKMLASCADWASARIQSDAKGRASEVIALVTAGEQNHGNAALRHCFLPHEFAEFVSKMDPTKGAIGLLNM